MAEMSESVSTQGTRGVSVGWSQGQYIAAQGLIPEELRYLKILYKRWKYLQITRKAQERHRCTKIVLELVKPRMRCSLKFFIDKKKKKKKKKKKEKEVTFEVR